MNFEFPLKELPAVMRGPRIERRRVLLGGSAFWGTMRDGSTLVLDDGRTVDAAQAAYLPPVNPSKIIAAHISYTSGQVVECEITGIGRIGGTVVAIDAPRAAALGVGHAPTDTPEVRRVAFGFDAHVPELFKDNLRRARKA